MPRHQTLVENRINMKLRYMLTGSDEDFSQRVREAVERRARFEAGNVEASDSQATTDGAEATAPASQDGWEADT